MRTIKKSARVILAVISLTLAACDDAREIWQIEKVLSGLPVHGVHGLAFGPEGGLYIGSVMGQSIVRLDVKTGTVQEIISAPWGEADDVAFAADGSLAWTALNQGELRMRDADGEIKTIAKDLPFVNPVTFGPDGTLYAATLFGPDRL